MKIILLIFSISLVLNLNNIYSQKKDSVDTSIQVKTSKINGDNVYELLYENVTKTNENLYSTIHWIIGIMVTFFLAIIGTQIFFNYRINKQEIENIRSELSNDLSDIKTNILLEISDEIKQIKKDMKEINKRNIYDLKENNKIFLADKGKLIDAYHETHQKNIEQAITQFKDIIKNIEIETNKNTGDLWVLKGVKSNAITHFVNSALLLKEMGRDIQYSLDDIIEILDKLSEIHESVFDDLEELLLHIPEKYNSKKAKIEESYKMKPTYKYVDSAPGKDGLPFTKVYTPQKV